MKSLLFQLREVLRAIVRVPQSLRRSLQGKVFNQFPFHIYQLEKSSHFRPTGVIHIGAHDGAEVPFYFALGIKRVYLFEPQSFYADLLHRRYGSDRRVKVFPFAVGSSTKELALFTEVEGSPNRSASASILKPKEHLTDFDYVRFNLKPTNKVHVRTLDSFELADVDLLVIDTQGYELEVLKGALNTLPSIKWIVFEYWTNEAYEGVPSEEDLLAFVAAQGFRPLLKSFDRTFGDYFVARPEQIL
jgi:FkbM family methyltransferase